MTRQTPAIGCRTQMLVSAALCACLSISAQSVATDEGTTEADLVVPWPSKEDLDFADSRTAAGMAYIVCLQQEYRRDVDLTVREGRSRCTTQRDLYATFLPVRHAGEILDATAYQVRMKPFGSSTFTKDPKGVGAHAE